MLPSVVFELPGFDEPREMIGRVSGKITRACQRHGLFGCGDRIQVGEEFVNECSAVYLRVQPGEIRAA